MAYQQASGDNNAPDYAEWKQVSVQMGSPEQTAYFDIFNRPLRTTVENFAGDGTYITDIEYDARGLNAFESAPYETGNSRYGTRYTAYDSLGRLTGKSVDQVDTSLVTRYIHSGFTTTIEAGNLPDMTRSYNSLNQLLHTQDADSGETHYAYDSMGNPIVIRDANGNDIKASYNGLGHKLYVDDPNMGRTDFINNSFGEVENENDANGDVLDYTYDTLGRLTVRTTTQVISGVPDSTAVFVWDNVASGCKKGLLCSETENGMSRAYQYDSASRITQTTTTLDGTPYVTTQHYDGNYGRPKALVYPNELTVGLDYNLQGYLTSENNAASGYVYRTVSAMDAFGNIAEASISDDILSGTYLYSQKTGQMLSSVVEQGSSVVHELNYSDYDEFGNIKTQSNLVTGTSETFNYDNLHRLTSNVAKDNGATIQSVTYDYDGVGNFKYKSDYSTTASNAYQYGENGAGPNAVSTVVKPSGPVNFGYDAKGNMTSGDDLNATYTAYGKPYSLTKNGAASTFSYGSDRARFKQQKGSDTTYYIDKLFEVEGNDWRAYISDVAVIKHSETSGTIDTQIRFLHRDRLGSAETLTDHNGQVTERRRFDPFGKPRGINSESLLPARLSSFGTDVDISKRGFTDHEHLDEQELIHMNGRVYDYNVGRFMSVDPFIQSPGNSQSINPYSYIMNNPLGGIDPTGYRACKATGSNIASECGSGDGHEDNSSTKVVNGGAKGNGAKITSASIIATWQSTLDLENQQKVASTEPEPTVENEGGVKSDPLANKNQQADNNGTEVASNNTSFESIVEKKWKRVFEDGKSVTKTDKVGEEKLLSEEAHGGFLNGLGTLLDKTKLLRGPLAQAVTFDVIYQEYGVFEQWELIEIPKLIQVTRVGEYQYHTRTIGIGNERKTGRKEWRFTNRYTDLDWRVIGCLFTCAPVTGMMKEND
jgi:RHS repeat-associated protein